MPAESITRRTALAILSAAPVAAHAALQTPAARPRRVVLDGSRGFVRESDGSVVAWRQGGGFRGLSLGLGHDNDVPPYIAFPVPGLSDVVDVACGGYGGYALTADGRVHAWGVNARGGLGNTPLAEFEAKAATRGSSLAPAPVPDLPNITAISASGYGYHAFALAKDGTVYAWGGNAKYQLGIGEWPVINYKTRSAQPTNYMPYPVRIPDLTGVVALATGDEHALALLGDGTVRGWGFNRFGQVGDGTVTDRKTPVPVSGIKNAVAIAAGSRISGAVLADGTVMTWGFTSGALGRVAPKPDSPSPTPAPVAGVTGIRGLALAETHALALTSASTVLSWGDDAHGRLGHRQGPGPAAVGGLAGVQSIAIGGASCIVVTSTGRIMIWGVVPRWARVDGDDQVLARTPIPLVLKGLKNS